jgi:hypothetical protein
MDRIVMLQPRGAPSPMAVWSDPSPRPVVVTRETAEAWFGGPGASQRGFHGSEPDHHLLQPRQPAGDVALERRGHQGGVVLADHPAHQGRRGVDEPIQPADGVLLFGRERRRREHGDLPFLLEERPAHPLELLAGPASSRSRRGGGRADG